MKKISLREIADAIGGKICGCKNPEDTFTIGVSIDSRQELLGKLFVALNGERVDGHDFVEVAFEKGAVCCLCEKETKTDGILILVKSTHNALKDLAGYYREILDIKVVAITGSVGKTTTKDMIASVLSQKYEVLKTEGNFNNEIGLPLTIFNIEEKHEVAVLEMGMSDFGEIDRLSKIAKPDACIITNIGFSHIENLGSREGILKAKCEIFNYMKKDGKIVLNGDDDLLLGIKDKFHNILYYGLNKENEIIAEKISSEDINSIQAEIHIPLENAFDVVIPYPGKHMVSNALGAAVIGNLLGLSTAQIKMGIEKFKLSKMRMDIFKTDGGIIVINDVYNASPSSVEASIDILTKANGRKVCILGDMFELGEYSEKLHSSIGKYVSEAEKNIDLIIFLGEKSRFGFEMAKENCKNDLIYYFENQEKMLGKIDILIKPDDVVLVKASRGMGLEKTVDYLKNMRWNNGN